MRVKLNLLIRDSRASRAFDALRWFSAFYVMVSHLRPVLFASYTQSGNTSTLVKAIYAATSMGSEFVMLFFVLSGYLISSSVLKAVSDGTWSWRNYLTNRLVRLWIVLIPALLLTYVWAQLQTSLFGSSAYFQNNMNWTHFLGNLFFLQGIFVTNYGGNGPLWSLAYEFWYYMLFPCLVLMLASRRWPHRLMYAGLAALISITVGKAILLYFGVWLLGTLLAVVPALPVAKRFLMLIAAPVICAALGAALLLSRYYFKGNGETVTESHFVASFTVGLLFTALLYVILHTWNVQPVSSLRTNAFEFHAFMAGFSYTLYLTHYPVVNFIRVWLGDGKWGTWNPDLLHLLLGIAACLGVVGYALLVSLVSEAHTAAVRKAVNRQINRIAAYRAGIGKPAKKAGAQW